MKYTYNIHEIYMANARRPNATYILLTGVGGWRRGQRKFKGLRWLQDTKNPLRARAA